MPELEGLPYPKDRGKIINCWVSNFVRDDEQPFDFDDFKSIIYSGKATEHPDHNPIDLVENYLNRHGDEVIERIDTLEVDKLSMKLMIVRYISNKTIFKTKIFDFFESLIQYDMEQCQLEYDLLRYFEIWNRINAGYEEESAKIYREIIEKMIDHVISSNYEGNYHDWFVACFSNWYFLSMADYIKYCNKDGIDKELVCSLLVRIMESPNNYASSFSLVFGIVYYWSLSDNEGLSVRIRDRIKSDPNCLDIVESCLKYNNLHSTIIRWINEDELFESIINDRREDNRNLDDALHRLGFHTALLHEREGAYLLNIDRGIVCGKYAFLRGIIQFVLYSMKKEEDPSRTIDLLSKAELDEGMHVTSVDMLHLFEETQSFDSRLLVFMIKLYRCNISFVWKKDWKFIQSVYAKDPVQALEMMTALAENTKISFHDEDSLYRLVETMVSDYKTDARIRKIINGLIRNQRLVRYSDFLD